MKWRDLRVCLQGLCARLSKPHAQPRAGVRALIVASKPGNAGGAKGCRKVETPSLGRAEAAQRSCSKGLLPVGETDGPRGLVSNRRCGMGCCWRPPKPGDWDDGGASYCPCRISKRLGRPSLREPHVLGLPVPLRVKPPTGEPDAGDPPVRFGGRGGRKPSLRECPNFCVRGLVSLTHDWARDYKRRAIATARPQSPDRPRSPDCSLVRSRCLFLRPDLPSSWRPRPAVSNPPSSAGPEPRAATAWERAWRGPTICHGRARPPCWTQVAMAARSVTAVTKRGPHSCDAVQVEIDDLLKRLRCGTGAQTFR